MTDSTDIVTFENSRGEEISNDPRWHAKKVLAATGTDVNDLQEQIERLTRERDEALAAAAAGVGDENPDDDDDDESAPYADVKGQDLVDLAKSRNISLKHEDGSKLKAGEVRAALAEQDAAK